jgi:crossover junction endodeoxyribonuclease RuvC
MRVLGIDPGSHRTGWGLVDRQGSRLTHVASGTVVVGDLPLATRLKVIADGLAQVLTLHRPDAVAVETLFYARNAASALQLGHARGVALLCAAQRGLPVFEYTAGQIKQATTGRGRAGKEQVQAMVKVALGVQGAMGLDASDALAAAITHAFLDQSPTAALLRSVSGAVERPRRGPVRAP